MMMPAGFGTMLALERSKIIMHAMRQKSQTSDDNKSHASRQQLTHHEFEMPLPNLNARRSLDSRTTSSIFENRKSANPKLTHHIKNDIDLLLPFARNKSYKNRETSAVHIKLADNNIIVSAEEDEVEFERALSSEGGKSQQDIKELNDENIDLNRQFEIKK